MMIPSIVVVDDEPDVRSLLQDVLSSRGFKVVTVRSADLVQSLDSSVQPGLFLIDLMLPGMSGIELAQQLRGTSQYADTPMIALSGFRFKLNRARESELFDEILAKPFEVGTLLDVIQRYAPPVSK